MRREEGQPHACLSHSRSIRMPCWRCIGARPWRRLRSASRESCGATNTGANPTPHPHTLAIMCPGKTYSPQASDTCSCPLPPGVAEAPDLSGPLTGTPACSDQRSLRHYLNARLWAMFGRVGWRGIYSISKSQMKCQSGLNHILMFSFSCLREFVSLGL